MRHKFLTLLALIFIAQYVTAQSEEKIIGGNSLGYAIPQGGFDDIYDHGIGFYGSLDYKLSDLFSLRGDLGWYDFSGPEREYVNSAGNLVVDHPSRTVWEVTAGAKVQVSILYLEARAGYFSSFDAFGVVPAIGLRIGKFDVQGNYVFAGTDEFASVRIGYYWATSKK